MTSNDASELRITIARVLEQWQRERMELGDETSIERDNVEALDVRLRQLEASETERWEDLARLQAEMLTALRRQLTRRARRALLSEHIDDLKRAITPTLTPSRFDAEVCDQCGATLAMVSDGDGSEPRMFCPQCQPDQLPDMDEEWESPEVKETIMGLLQTGGATLGKGRRLTQAETESFQPQRLAVAPDFAAWLNSQGLEIVSIDDQGAGKALMTLGPIEGEEESDPK